MASARRTGTNENISTGGDATRDYDLTAGELTNWEADTDYGLVAATTTEVLEHYADASFDLTGTANPLIFTGATTNASYFRIMRPATGNFHDGIPGGGVVYTATDNRSVFRFQEAYFSCQDIEISGISLAQGGTRIMFRTDNSTAEIVGCICYDITNTSTSLSAGLWGFGTTNGGIIVNCIAIDISVPNGSGTGKGFYSFSGTGYYYNNTAVDCDVGYLEDTTMIRKNCIADGCTDDVSGTPTDTTCYDSGDAGKGLYVLTYVNSGGNDFHITAGDHTTMGAGTDLSADGTFPFDDDIDRVTISVWSRGFDSDPAVAAAGVPPWVLKPQIQGAGVL